MSQIQEITESLEQRLSNKTIRVIKETILTLTDDSLKENYENLYVNLILDSCYLFNETGTAGQVVLTTPYLSEYIASYGSFMRESIVNNDLQLIQKMSRWHLFASNNVPKNQIQVISNNHMTCINIVDPQNRLT